MNLTYDFPGSKSGSGVYQAIINQIPPHHTYIEPFLGLGAILRRKLPAPESIAIDVNVISLRRFRRCYQVPNLTLYHTDAIYWLEMMENFLTPNGRSSSATFIYCDPPYVLSSRSQQEPIYTHEMTDQDHIRLLTILDQIPCSIAISGYWSELYVQHLQNWRVISYNTRTRGGRTVREYLWMNYPQPEELHDYRYLGADFRERERIKRKINRWVNKLQGLPPLERNAILTALTADTATSSDQVRPTPSLLTDTTFEAPSLEKSPIFPESFYEGN